LEQLDPRLFFFSSRRRHTRFSRDWSSDVCSSDLKAGNLLPEALLEDPEIRMARDLVVWAPSPSRDAILARIDEFVGKQSALEERSEERRVGEECRAGWGADR